MRRALALALLVSSALPAACSCELLDADPFAEPDLSASVRIPLRTTTDDGTTYLLRDATVEISGAAMLTLSAQGEADLSTPLPAGSYTLFLRPGYRVLEVGPDGQQRELAVQPLGTNPQRFTVREVEDATLRLSFTHEARELVFGARSPVHLTRR